MSETRSILLLWFTAFGVGLVGAIVAGLIVQSPTGGLYVSPLLGGSWIGWFYPNKALPLWYRFITGAIAATLGWFLSVVILHAILK